MDYTVSIKRQIQELEITGKRFPIYTFLSSEWAGETHRSQLALLVIQQMVYYLIDLEDPRISYEREDEYELYYALLQDALQYGMEHCINDKEFLWQMCLYLSGIATYHFLCGKTIPYELEGVFAIRDTLFDLSKQSYPESKLFSLIPAIMRADYAWYHSINKHDRFVIADEVSEWDLQSNEVDEALKVLFEEILSQ